jgi:cold shock CspA family protein
VNNIRFFGVVIAATGGGFVVDRDDDGGRVYVSAREADTAGELQVGDRVEFSLHPGGMAVDALLVRRGRRLLASGAAS